MKVVIVYPNREDIGLEVEATRLAATLSACGHEIIAFGARQSDKRILKMSGISVYDTDELISDKKLGRFIIDLAPDIVHIFGIVTARSLTPMIKTHVEVITLTVPSERDEDISKYDLRGISTIYVDTELTKDFYSRRVTGGIRIVSAPYILPDFLPPVDLSDYQIAYEWGLVFDAPTIMIADSFTREGSNKLPLALLAITPQLIKRIPGLQIIIAGDGSQLDAVVKRSEEINGHYKRKVVSCLGFVEDVFPLIKIATVCLGNGRFALESLYSSKAVIAAGSKTLFGAITKENYQTGASVAFGKYSLTANKKLTEKGLLTEISGLFDHPTYRYNFAKNGRDIASELNQGLLAVLSGYLSADLNLDDDKKYSEEVEGDIVIVAPDNLYNTLQMLPVCNAIREKYIRKRINIIANKEEEALLRRTNIFDIVYIYPESLKDFCILSFTLFRSNFLYFLSMRNTPKTGLLSLLSFAKKRYGISSGGSTLFCYTDYIDDFEAPQDIKLRALSLAGFIGVTKSTPLKKISLPDSIITFSAERRVVMLAVGRYDDKKEWLKAVEIVKKSGLAEPVVLTDGDDTSYESDIQVINIASFDDLSLAALISKARLVVANEGSIVAVASMIPQVACIEVPSGVSPEVLIADALHMKRGI